MNDYAEDEKYSRKAGEEGFWLDVYMKAFSNFSSMSGCIDDINCQKKGIDRIIRLSSGVYLTIDEKKRREVWDDILLEFISNDVTNAPGWMERNLNINYISYAFMPIKRVYVLDWQMLRRVWVHFGEEWKVKYKTVKAPNKGYITHSVPVPINVLLSKMRSAIIIDV